MSEEKSPSDQKEEESSFARKRMGEMDELFAGIEVLPEIMNPLREEWKKLKFNINEFLDNRLEYNKVEQAFKGFKNIFSGTTIPHTDLGDFRHDSYNKLGPLESSLYLIETHINPLVPGRKK